MDTIPKPDFIHQSPIAVARRHAEADLSNKATVSETRWLYEHPLLWLRVLAIIRREVENHIAKDRRSLVDLKPPSGTHASAQYLAAKREVDARAARRLHFLQIAERRAEEVKGLISPEPLAEFFVGDLVDVFESIAAAAESGDGRGAAALARCWAKKVADPEWGDSYV